MNLVDKEDTPGFAMRKFIVENTKVGTDLQFIYLMTCMYTTSQYKPTK